MKFLHLPSRLSAVKVTGYRENLDGQLTRRGILKAGIIGAVLAPLFKLGPRVRKTENRDLVRPPFSRTCEDEFLDACIRCGLCMQVCPTNTLQPAYLEAGAEGVMTPVLTPEIAGCEGGCSACGEVCPTNAIVKFAPEEKLMMKQGTAKLELDRCIGYTENADCNKCVKKCPAQAIKVSRLDGVAKPVRIESSQCTGCGLCEAECNRVVANRSACVTTGKGRGLATDYSAILKTLEQKKHAGKEFLPFV